jgi:NADPH:quinone reductase-like Zn-dependent oxidoreductase
MPCSRNVRSASASAADLPGMTGKTVIVTGASSGVGQAVARVLAGSGTYTYTWTYPTGCL